MTTLVTTITSFDRFIDWALRVWTVTRDMTKATAIVTFNAISLTVSGKMVEAAALEASHATNVVVVTTSISTTTTTAAAAAATTTIWTITS
jgi:hypothetical protein